MFFYEWIISFYQRSVVIYLTAVQFTTFEFPAGLSLTSVASSLSFFISPMSTILLYFYGFFRMSGEKVENRFSINFLLNRLLRLK